MGSWSRRRSFAELSLSDSGTEINHVSGVLKSISLCGIHLWRVADEARPQVAWLWTLLILT